MNKKNKAVLVIISEIIFTVMPVLIVISIKLYKNEMSEIFKITDWSFLAIIFMGQSLIKFIIGISSNKNIKETNIIMFITTLLIVLGLIPPIIIFVMISLSTTEYLCLYILQAGCFILSVIIYFIIGSVSQILIENITITKQDLAKK